MDGWMVRKMDRYINLLLLLPGQYGGQDYIMIELVLGSLRITVRWGNWDNELFISSRSKPLSDGQWHKITVQLTNKVSYRYTW